MLLHEMDVQDWPMVKVIKIDILSQIDIRKYFEVWAR